MPALIGMAVMAALAKLGLNPVVAGLIGGGVWTLISVSRQELAETKRVNQEAAKQERQARLTAGAIAERDIRQRLGEFCD